jgi:tellurite resistance protein TehA-like permease
MCTAVASVLLIAPTVLHRLRFREEDKEHLLQTSNRLAIVGTFFLALAITLVVFLIGDVLYGGGWAIASGGFIGLLFLLIWYAYPIRRRLTDRR